MGLVARVTFPSDTLPTQTQAPEGTKRSIPSLLFVLRPFSMVQCLLDRINDLKWQIVLYCIIMMAQNRLIQQHPWILCTPLVLAYCCTFLFLTSSLVISLQYAHHGSQAGLRTNYLADCRSEAWLRLPLLKVKTLRDVRDDKSHEQTSFTAASHFPLILLKTDKQLTYIHKGLGCSLNVI